MLYIYRTIINFVFFLSPIILIIRLLKKKEDLIRFKEKIGFFSKKKVSGKLIWFHGASVGELQSIIPLLEKFEKDKKINQILITSNTLSSSKITKQLKLKKIIHQFFPIDTNFLSKKFLDHWKPSQAFFIDSEIWPNTILNLKYNKIPTILLNGRITKKTYKRWKYLPTFSKKIFSQFDLCLASSKESFGYLKDLNVKRIKYIGNLKFSQSEKKDLKIDNKFKNFFKKKIIWCASSTHENEEEFCGLIHKELKKKYRNLLTIIIPRHINRVSSIIKQLHKLDLKTHTYHSNEKIKKDTDIFIVDAYGKTKSFYNFCKHVFLGGSIINHGGQNPLEATRYGCNILHGPNVSNFREIYSFLKKNKVSQNIKDKKEMIRALSKLFSKKSESKKIKKRLDLIGQKILDSTYKEVKPLS